MVQIITGLVPVVNMVDKNRIVATRLAYFLAAPFYAIDQTNDNSIDYYFFGPINTFVAHLIPQRADVVMAGHSLGGGIAQIVAAKNNLKAVSFSAPGVMLGRKSFMDLSQAAIQQNLINVWPYSDIVPAIDTQGVLVQGIRCNQPNFIDCHSINNTITELSSVCGDPYGRVVLPP